MWKTEPSLKELPASPWHCSLGEQWLCPSAALWGTGFIPTSLGIILPFLRRSWTGSPETRLSPWVSHLQQTLHAHAWHSALPDQKISRNKQE